MLVYNIIVKDKSGNKLGELTEWVSIKFSKKLNDYGEATITIPLSQPYLAQLTSLRNYEIDIMRNGTLVWSGEQVHRSCSIKPNSSNLVSITCYGHTELLSHMYTEEYQIYDQIDAGAIAWDCIDTFQNKTNGNLGITEGDIQATKLRDRKYYSKNIHDLIVELTEVIEGFDFEITDSKVFNVYTHKGVDKSATEIFDLDTNIQEVTRIEEDFTNPINQAIILGEELDNIQQRTEVTDVPSTNAIKLRQGKETAFNVTEADTFTDKGEELVRRNKTPIVLVEFTQIQGTRPYFGALNIGDTIKLRIIKEIYNINTKFRIYGWRVVVDATGEEEVEYLVSVQS